MNTFITTPVFHTHVKLSLGLSGQHAVGFVRRCSLLIFMFLFYSLTVQSANKTTPIDEDKTMDAKALPRQGMNMPGRSIVNGGLDLNRGSNFVVNLNGPTAGSSYSQVIAGGMVKLAGSVELKVNHRPSAAEVYTLINQSGSSAINGTFAGLEEGERYASLSAQVFRASYMGGTGNDFTMTALTNSPPVITVSGVVSSFIQGDNTAGTPVRIDAGLTVSDSDNPTLAFAQITIRGNFQVGGDILSFTNDSDMGNISGTYNTTTGVMTLTSANSKATLAQWQHALRAVTYGNSALKPTTASRSISFVINDGKSSSVPVVKVVHVQATNQSPIISGIPATTVLEGVAYSFVPTVQDADDAVLEFSIKNIPRWANFDRTTGALTGIPGRNNVGVSSGIVISVSDGKAEVSLPPFDLQVLGLNTAPTISGTPATTVLQDKFYSFLPTAYDADGDALRFSIHEKPRWATFDKATGALTGTPSRADVGISFGVVITVTDGDYYVSLPDFNLEVVGLNTAPTISGTPATTVLQDAAYSFLPTAYDAEGDALTFMISNKPNWASFDAITGALTGTPSRANVGVSSGIVIMVMDGREVASLPAFDLEVLYVNAAPSISGTPATTVNQDIAYSFLPAAQDSDGDALTFSINKKPIWASFDAFTGALTGTPSRANVGRTSGIVINVTDGTASTSLPAFDLEVFYVNAAPSISGTPATTVNQDIAYSFLPVAQDADGDALTFNISNMPTWANFDPATGALTGTPRRADVGITTSIVISVSDGKATATLPPFNVTVLYVNAAPSISGTPATTINQDIAYSFLPTAKDSDGDALMFSINEKPIWASFDAFTGALTGMPSRANVGVTSGIVISVTDGTETVSLPAFDLEVLYVNAAPSISGTPLQFIRPADAYSFLPTAQDSDGDALTFSINKKPIWASFDAFTGALTGMPSRANVGVTSGIVITVSDGTETVSLPAFSIEVGPGLPIEGLELVTKSFVYDGQEKFLAITGLLPEGTSISYQNDRRTDVGTQLVTARVDGGDRYEDLLLTASLTITKADLGKEISFSKAIYVYDGNPKSVLIKGDLPFGVKVSYQDNVAIDAGNYNAKVEIDGGLNYNSQSLQTLLTIEKKQQLISFAPIRAVHADAGLVRLELSSNSNLPMQTSSDNLLVATVEATAELQIKGLGYALIRVEQAGDANHFAAATVTQMLEVLAPENSKLPVILHQAVSPNGDGINDFLRIEGIELYPENKLSVYDANGRLLKEIKAYNNSNNYFDGLHIGNTLLEGTYFYVLTIKVNGKWQHDKGFFVIKQ